MAVDTTFTTDCRTVDLTATRTALTAALEAETFDSQPLRVNAWLADQWAPPCALIGTFALTYQDTAFAGIPTALILVRAVVNAQAARPAQLDLDAMTGAVSRALLADRHLGGAVSDCRPVRTTATTMTRGAQELPATDIETMIVF